MLCPMKFNQVSGNSEGFSPAINDSSDNCLCEQSNCAWWTTSEEDQGYCAIIRISESLDKIRTDLVNKE